MLTSDYLDWLHCADGALNLCERGLRPPGPVIPASELWTAWPPGLLGTLEALPPEELLWLQFTTERHYAAQIKKTCDPVVQDRLLALAYLRVVQLQILRGEPDMGFDSREYEFALSVVAAARRSGIPNPRVLEVGCGTGSLLSALAGSGLRSLVGVDIAPAAVETSAKRLSAFGLEENVWHATPKELVDSGIVSAFDIVFLCDVIEHIPMNRLTEFLADIRSLLAPPGRLVVVTPNAHAGPHDITRYFKPMGSAPEGLHLREYSLADLRHLLESAGFERLEGRSLLPGCRGRAAGLSEFSTRVRLGLETALPGCPRRLKGWLVHQLYFAAVCAEKSA